MSNHRKTIETHHQQWSHHPNAGCTCGEKYDHKTREQDHTTHLYAVHEQLIRAQVAQEILRAIVPIQPVGTMHEGENRGLRLAALIAEGPQQ